MRIHVSWDCPKCGHKMIQKDQLVTDEDERIRRKVCPNCGRELYTLEFEIDKSDWKKHCDEFHRNKGKYYYRRRGKFYVEQAV